LDGPKPWSKVKIHTFHNFHKYYLLTNRAFSVSHIVIDLFSVLALEGEPNSGATRNRHDFYSTFYKTPNRKKFLEEECEEFTEDSTIQAFAQLASSLEFTDWVIRSADRIKVASEDSSDDLDAKNHSIRSV
jgi:predicted house-cleaning noncanonical NTP pyrophosphatase (MazG superfamily)